MPLNQKAKDEFIKELADDLIKKVPNPSAEVKSSMEEYSATLYKHISKLILSATITNTDGTASSLTIK
jgi:multisubunit Na+/H+ antiporter MnhE subunit